MSAPLAITMGDAAGIGPEIIARHVEIHGPEGLVVLGDPAQMRRAFALIGSRRGIVSWDQDQPLKMNRKIGGTDSPLAMIDTGSVPTELPYGAVSAESGALAHAAILRAIDLAMAGVVAGLVTAPIHKESLHAAGVPFPGHTEILADRTGTRDFAMMLAEGPLRVILVSIHVSLRQALDLVTETRVLRTIRLADQACRALGIARPRIAVAGLNPHAGEGGLFGSEDKVVIAPAIDAARKEGLDASGPYPPDTVFMRARRGAFDIVVAQYHDQGLIPVKLNGIEKGVNVTIGLPIIRTSVDHGTAFDIAGKGVADPASLGEAIAVARRMIEVRR
ncbi:MAG: 4-hydroxythreonine-4-phosphate dehydrogenase PdxA [Beijerinckiaceae bacterium]|nr:4-hydroxythreonine-4-phosphate dehydrogenase PdxA [Beijerinckiaceae bacterium]